MAVQYYTDEMRMYWEFIAERHRIYKRKELEKLPPPWTDNGILRDYKFTNVFRELDRGSKYLIDKVCENDKLDINTKIFNVLIYRIFNKIETFEKLGITKYPHYKPEKFTKILEEMYANGERIFTSAFIVSGYSQYGQGLLKYKRVVLLIEDLQELLLKTNILQTITNTEDMKDAFYATLGICGYGEFLGYQCSVDYSYCPEIKFGEDDFTIMGPGARRGISALFPDEMIGEHGYEWLCEWLRNHQVDFFEDYGIDYKELLNDRDKPYVTLMALENCCCEFSKYYKAVTGTGRPRNKYDESDGYERISQDGYMQWDNK